MLVCSLSSTPFAGTFNQSALLARIAPQLQLLRDYLKKLSMREKVLVLAAFLAVAGSVAYLIYSPIQEAFNDQTRRLEESTQQLQNVSMALARYQKLRARREEIEKEFHEVEIEEGALSYLEDLVKTKAGVLNPQINPREIREFGAEYEQAPFSVRFPIVDLARLVQFLEALVRGEKPFILAGIDIKRRPAGDSLDVDLEVSSIRRKKTS